MSSPRDLRLADGRSLRVHDGGGSEASARLTLLWHHGSPQTGALLDPLRAAADARGIRLIGYGRPGYGGSSPLPDRNVAAAAADAAALADALGLDRFAVMGHSGGGPHALACAARLPERVTGVVSLAGLAPFDAPGLDFFAGMADPSGLRAAAAGRVAREEHEATAAFDPASFTPRDHAALAGPWASLPEDVGRAAAAGSAGMVADDLAFARPWGFALASVTAPVLIVQGGEDRIVPPAHGDWLMRHLPAAELWFRPRDGHIGVLDAAPVAMDWLLAHA